MGMVRNGRDQSGHGTQNWQYIKIELMEWTDFLHAGANSGMLKAILMILWLMWSKMGVAI